MTAGISLPSFGSRASGLWLTLFMLAPTILPALSSATPVEVLYGPEDKPLDRVVALYHPSSASVPLRCGVWLE